MDGIRVPQAHDPKRGAIRNGCAHAFQFGTGFPTLHCYSTVTFEPALPTTFQSISDRFHHYLSHHFHAFPFFLACDSFSTTFEKWFLKMVDFVRTIFDWKWLKTAVGNLMGKLVENWLKEVLNKWLTNFFFFFQVGGGWEPGIKSTNLQWVWIA